MVVEGTFTTQRTAEISPEIDTSRIIFQHGDACNLDNSIGKFDVVLLANLICRLPQPKACLEKIGEVVRKGGILVIVTPCTWLEQFTEKKDWLCYIGDQKQLVRTLESMTSILSPWFELVESGNTPFLIREHERKYQFSISQTSVWIRI